MDEPTFGSVFSGIGGLDLGLERSGWRCAWQVENDKYCRRILRKHWPEVPKYGDIKTVNFDRLERVDLIAGGFPCQPVSNAGKRLAQADERWLWPEFTRAIRALSPRFILVENVPGLLVRGFGDVLGDLAAIGYDAEWDVLSAADFGAPHIRKRVLLVAYANGDGQGRRADQQESEQERAIQTNPIADGEERTLADADHQRHPTNQQGQSGSIFSGAVIESSDWWQVEPDVGRVAYGIPHRVDRIRVLGNAVVPQVAEWIGRRLLEAL